MQWVGIIEDSSKTDIIYASSEQITKNTNFRATIDILRWWHELMHIPCVAIGGITVENGADLVRAGADFLAVIGAVWNHSEGPAEGVSTMNAMMLKSCSGNIASMETK